MAMGHSLLRISIRRCQHAHIDVLLGAPSKPAEFALFEHSQQLGLGADRHLAELIQQQRSAGGQFEAPGAPLHRSGKRAFFVPENLAFNQGFREWPPQLTARNGRLLRGLRSCSVRATISLPVPLSPVISTETFDGAICSISPKISRIALELPTIEPRMPVLRSCLRVTSSSISVARCRVAFARIVRSRVASTGFCRKS